MEHTDEGFSVMFADGAAEEVRGANGFRTSDIRRIVRRPAPALRAVSFEPDGAAASRR
ncbi:MAG TPA: hypothetical protein VI854_08335 [Acidimicrobiia bacterium]|nr:hypothetical protein [Acidimicrobiia bacterium]